MVESILQTSLPQTLYSIFQIKSERILLYWDLWNNFFKNSSNMRMQADTDSEQK